MATQTIKIVMVGNHDVGKTNLLVKYTEDEFDPTVSSTTVAVDYFDKDVQLQLPYEDESIDAMLGQADEAKAEGDRKEAAPKGERRKLMVKAGLWDTAGQERFKSMSKSAYRAAAAAIMVFDITNEESFIALGRDWNDMVLKHAPPDIIRIIVGSKHDLGDEKRKVSTQRGEELAARLGGHYVETSVITGHNVDRCFQMALLYALEVVTPSLGLFSASSPPPIRSPSAAMDRVNVVDKVDAPRQEAVAAKASLPRTATAGAGLPAASIGNLARTQSAAPPPEAASKSPSKSQETKKRSFWSNCVMI